MVMVRDKFEMLGHFALNHLNYRCTQQLAIVVNKTEAAEATTTTMTTITSTIADWLYRDDGQQKMGAASWSVMSEVQ